MEGSRIRPQCARGDARAWETVKQVTRGLTQTKRMTPFVSFLLMLLTGAAPAWAWWPKYPHRFVLHAPGCHLRVEEAASGASCPIAGSRWRYRGHCLHAGRRGELTWMWDDDVLVSTDDTAVLWDSHTVFLLFDFFSPVFLRTHTDVSRFFTDCRSSPSPEYP